MLVIALLVILVGVGCRNSGDCGESDSEASKVSTGLEQNCSECHCDFDSREEKRPKEEFQTSEEEFWSFKEG